MPLEVWKTRMGRFRSESALTAFRAVYASGGPKAFWQSLDAKLVEASTKGLILLVVKEKLLDVLSVAGVSPFYAGLVAGAGGGVAQVAVLGPCTYLVTARVNTSGPTMSTMERARTTYATAGVRGFYPGGTALAFRQATNWASRQGITEGVRSQLKLRKGDEKAKLSIAEEMLSGIVGGTLSAWNHPFEVARIDAQSRAAGGQASLGMVPTMAAIVRESGVGGLFTGLTPRVLLGVWQTLFMVTGTKIVKDMLAGDKSS